MGAPRPDKLVRLHPFAVLAEPDRADLARYLELVELAAESTLALDGQA
jgi:hypothetical protein